MRGSAQPGSPRRRRAAPAGTKQGRAGGRSARPPKKGATPRAGRPKRTAARKAGKPAASKRRTPAAPAGRRRRPTKQAPARRKAQARAATGGARRPPAARGRRSRPSPGAARIRELEERVASLEAQLAAAQREADALGAQLRSSRAAPEPPPPAEGTPAAPAPPGAAYEESGETLEEEFPYEDYDEQEDFSDTLGGMEHRRRELDRERADRELELSHEPFWMVCPKCGERLSDHEFDNIKTERCESCGGLWIDKGEIELLLLFSEENRVLAYRTRGLLQ